MPRLCLALLLVGASAFAPAPRGRLHSALFGETDFIKPLVGRQVNFGDEINSYWGAAEFEKTHGVPPPMNDGVYEVMLARPLGIVFEEVIPGLPKGVRVAEVWKSA